MDIDRNTLDGRVVLITGSAQGIGASLAQALADFGSRVLLLDILDEGAEVAGRVQSEGGSAHFYKIDLADSTAAAEIAARLIDQHGQIDVLVNNAARMVPVSIQASSPSSWEEPFRIAVETSAVLTSSVLGGMLERGYGTIANTIAAEGLSFAGPFSSAMAGSRSMVLSLAGELAEDGAVKVFGFAPGLTDTQLARDYIEAAAKKQCISPGEWISNFAHNPGYRGLMPAEDCAASYCYSLSHASSLHGQVADAFQPLINAGVIQSGSSKNVELQNVASRKLSNTIEQIGEYVSGIASVNRNLEIRIAERTKELQEANSQLADQKRSIEHLASVISRYLPEQVYQSIFEGSLNEDVSSRRRFLTIMFSDICDFSSKAEMLEPEALSEIMNLYFSDMTEIARDHGATIDKFIGDAILAFFGDPDTDGAEADAEKCIDMAIDMQRRVVEMQNEIKRLGLHEPLEVRIGINSGYCTVGNFGSFERMDYTIIGRPVNVAARLQSACRPGATLISHNTRVLLEDKFTLKPFGELSLKGIEGKVDAFEVASGMKDRSRKSGARSTPLSQLRDSLATEHFDALSAEKKQELLTTLSKILAD
jgi:class 3 adenylate cyclase/NAD(P)-dependent dehydrogenase (short-subunit alcohol dehydrogenase family)